MKIMCIIGCFSFGGAERVMTNLVNNLSVDNEVIFVSIHNTDSPAYTISNRVDVVNGLDFKNRFDAIFKLRKCIQREKPNVVLSFLTHVNITVLLASIGTGVPVVVSERNDPSKNISNVRKALRRLLYPLAKGIVFQTKDAQRFFSSTIQNKSRIITNPIFIESDCLNYECTMRKAEIVAVGRLDPQKNHRMLVDAFSLICEECKDYEVKIYGEGNEHDELEHYISEKGLTGLVKLCGQSKAIHEDIKDASLFVMTSDFEGMPNALMEAMALGLCCISTDCPVGGPRELIENGRNGVLVDVGDYRHLANEMLRLINDRTTAEELGKNAREIMERMNPASIYAQWREYLNSMVI